MIAAAALFSAAALRISGDMPPPDLHTLHRLALASLPDWSLPSLTAVIAGAVLLIGVLLLWAAISTTPEDFRDKDDPR